MESISRARCGKGETACRVGFRGESPGRGEAISTEASLQAEARLPRGEPTAAHSDAGAEKEHKSNKRSKRGKETENEKEPKLN